MVGQKVIDRLMTICYGGVEFLPAQWWSSIIREMPMPLPLGLGCRPKGYNISHACTPAVGRLLPMDYITEALLDAVHHAIL